MRWACPSGSSFAASSCPRRWPARPATGHIFIACLIGSSLAAAIGVVELTAVTQRINQDRAAGVITFLTSGLTYLAIAFAATKFGGLLERRLEFMGRGRA